MNPWLQWLSSSGPADWVLVLVGLGTVVAALKTLKAIERQVRANTEATEATSRAADAAMSSATTAKLTLLSQSAHVQVSRVGADTQATGLDSTISTLFKNFGGTPALDLVIKWTLGVMSTPLGELDIQQPPITLAPGAEVNVSAREPIGAALSEDEWREVITGKLRFGFWGNLTYGDIFGRRHHGTFVARLRTDGRLVIEEQTHRITEEGSASSTDRF